MCGSKSIRVVPSNTVDCLITEMKQSSVTSVSATGCVGHCPLPRTPLPVPLNSSLLSPHAFDYLCSFVPYTLAARGVRHRSKTHFSCSNQRRHRPPFQFRIIIIIYITALNCLHSIHPACACRRWRRPLPSSWSPSLPRSCAAPTGEAHYFNVTCHSLLFALGCIVYRDTGD